MFWKVSLRRLCCDFVKSSTFDLHNVKTMFNPMGHFPPCRASTNAPLVLCLVSVSHCSRRNEAPRSTPCLERRKCKCREVAPPNAFLTFEEGVPKNTSMSKAYPMVPICSVSLQGQTTTEGPLHCVRDCLEMSTSTERIPADLDTCGDLRGLPLCCRGHPDGMLSSGFSRERLFWGNCCRTGR